MRHQRQEPVEAQDVVLVNRNRDRAEPAVLVVAQVLLLVGRPDGHVAALEVLRVAPEGQPNRVLLRGEVLFDVLDQGTVRPLQLGHLSDPFPQGRLDHLLQVPEPATRFIM